jgi:acyl-CoA thioester hydrolase
MEKVLIETQLIRFGKKHVEVELRMWDEVKTTLKSFCWMGFVHFDLRTNKVREHSTEYLALFENVVSPVEETTFDARLRTLSGRRGD